MRAVRAYLSLPAGRRSDSACVHEGQQTPPLKQDAVASERVPVQKQVAARLDQTALPVLGELHDADCTSGQKNLMVRED